MQRLEEVGHARAWVEVTLLRLKPCFAIQPEAILVHLVGNCGFCRTLACWEVEILRPMGYRSVRLVCSWQDRRIERGSSTIMNLSEDPWQLPSARAFLSEIESQVAGGGCVAVKGGPSMPAGLDLALQQYLEANGVSVTSITPQAAELPLEALATPFGVPAELETLAQSGLSDHLAVIVATGLGSAPCAAWRIFLNRFRAARSKGASGLSVLFLAPDGFV